MAKRNEDREVGTFFNQEHYTAFLHYTLQCTKMNDAPTDRKSDGSLYAIPLAVLTGSAMPSRGHHSAPLTA